jgi:hypothetical protein
MAAIDSISVQAGDSVTFILYFLDLRSELKVSAAVDVCQWN